ncbi:MAG: BON domain-containing protein [Bacteroidetes bacterium]|nr:BON domain-containing protein [Bacteroidota bacterium]
MKTDEELQHDVMEEIKWDPRLKSIATQVGVTAKDGVITLSGEVDTYRKKIAAEHAAQRVAGVKVIAVNIQVNLEGNAAKTDIDIARAVGEALKWNSSINEDTIEVKVESGWVFLDGTVEWEFQRKIVEGTVHELAGVRGVTNRIVVTSKLSISPTEIKEKIASAFHRSATIDSSAVRVEVSGGKVKLIGKVRTWLERQEAENAAWSSAGVVEVDNKIEVDAALELV